MFVAGLNEEQSIKEGFLTFAAPALQVPVDLSDIKAMFRIPSEREALYKIIFKSNNVRNKFYNARKLLRNHSNIWFRDDLTRKREVMAKRLRHRVGLKNGETRPTRVSNLEDIVT